MRRMIIIGAAMTLSCMIATFAGPGNEVPNNLVQERVDPVIHPKLLEIAANKTDEAEVTVWIFFTDKGIFTSEAYLSGCQKAEESLSKKVQQRRGKVKGGMLTDVYDLAVKSEYVHAVLATGAKHRTTTRWLNGISAEVPVGELDRIASLPFVREIRPVQGHRREPLLSQPTPRLRTQRGSFQLDYGPSFDQLQQINVPAAHELGYSGAGVLICMLDSGFNREHESLQGIDVVAEWDFINDDGNTRNEVGDPQYQDYHGTRTLSVAGGSSPGNLYGPAYGASFLLGKTEDTSQEEPIEEDYWQEGIEWAEAQGADVVSSSLSYTEYWHTYADLDGNTAVTTRAADIAVSKGVVVCNSAGNYRDDPWYYIGAPADGDSVIAVGAVDSTGTISSFSSAGPTYDGRTKPEVVARGVDTRCANPGDPHGYQERNGTSYSCPLVAGCAALILEAHPEWTPMQVREALMMTADRAHSPDNLYGWGLIDVLAALTCQCTIELTSPHGGETWSAGATRTITWVSENTSGYVRIEYSTNGGADWSIVVASTPDDGSHAWTVPDTPSADCLVKVTDTQSAACSDESDDTFTITPPLNTVVVNTTDGIDDGTCDGAHCSLWEAIRAARANAGPDVVSFDIPQSDGGYDPSTGVWTIRADESLPILSSQTTIDGTTQTASQGDTNPFGPEIEIDGGVLGDEGVTGLDVSSSCTIRGLAIYHFAYAVWVDGIGSVIADCYIGTDATGQVGLGNRQDAVLIIDTRGDAQDNVVEGNLLSGNGGGVRIAGENARGNTIRYNRIGTDASGTSAIPNYDGVEIHAGARSNVVEHNLVSGNNRYGVIVDGGGDFSGTVGNTITANSITENGSRGIALFDGGNEDLAAPLISTASPTQVSGTACAHCVVEVFSDAEDEGAVFEGTTTADNSGNWTFSKIGGLTGPNVTATATDGAGNTSEFSDPVAVTLCCECADCNEDDVVNILDALWEVNCILGNTPPPCSCDCNEDGTDNILDVLCVVNTLLGNLCP